MSVLARQRWRERAGAGAAPPATDTVAPNIPGVVAGGTKVQVIKDGFNGTEGPIAMPDGSLIFTETTGNRITRIDADGKTSTFLENTNGSNGLAFDPQGRLLCGADGEDAGRPSSIRRAARRCSPTITKARSTRGPTT